ncbi:MAG: VWA domain-containing protein [Solirubrobacteraceae bacterium]|jgi:Ca-activated chloride channel homolog
MTFAAPLVLLALFAIPVLARLYAREQRRRVRAEAAFVAPLLAASVAPRRPRWRRHAPMLAFALALAVLIVAAARPQHSVAVPVSDGAIMLANDVSSSMTATDVAPTRLQAAKRAAQRFVASMPASVRVGLLEFASKPVVLQSPTTDHALTAAAFSQLSTSGGTAIGDAILTSLRLLTSLRAADGKRPPGAILLLSDGASNVGSSPFAAARQAAADHIPIDTVALGTANGTIPVKRGAQTVTVSVPPSPQTLADVASLSGGRSFTAADTGRLSAIYARLAAQFGHRRVKHELTADFAGGGLTLLLVGAVLSLGWFGRLI